MARPVHVYTWSSHVLSARPGPSGGSKIRDVGLDDCDPHHRSQSFCNVVFKGTDMESLAIARRSEDFDDKTPAAQAAALITNPAPADVVFVINGDAGAVRRIGPRRLRSLIARSYGSSSKIVTTDRHDFRAALLDLSRDRPGADGTPSSTSGMAGGSASGRRPTAQRSRPSWRRGRGQSDRRGRRWAR